MSSWPQEGIRRPGAKKATSTIPIVMNAGIRSCRAGLVESLARPGGNVTGLTSVCQELGGKRLELLKEVVPKTFSCRGSLRSGLAGNSARQTERGPPSRAYAEIDCSTLGGTRSGRFTIMYFAAAEKERADGSIVPSAGPLLSAHRKRIASFALKSRLPAMY